MNILSIDLSLNHFGYALFQDNEMIKYGNKETLKYKKDLYGRENIIYDFFRNFLIENNVDIILVEKFFIQNNNKTYGQLQILQGLVLSLSFLYKISFEMLNIGTYRKVLKIQGRKSDEIKIEVESRILKQYPAVINDKHFDITDAIAINLAYRIQEKIYSEFN